MLENLSEKHDKKALRQGRHLMLLFPPPKIVLSKEEMYRKIDFLPTFLAISLVICYVFVKFRYVI